MQSELLKGGYIGDYIGLRVLGYRVLGFGFRVQSTLLKGARTGDFCQVWGLGIRTDGLGCKG